MLAGKVLLIEFGNNCVRLALALGGIGAKRIYAFEKADAPVFAGEITEPELMKDIILTYLKKNNVKKCKVRIVLHHPQGIMRFMKLPKMKEADLEKAVQNRIAGLFPPSEKAFVYDYRNYSIDFEGVNVIAVRIPEDVSMSYANFFTSIGLKPISLDLYTNAASVYLERHQSGNFDAVFENPLSVNILRFVDGRLVSARDIRYDDKAYAEAEIKSYMKLYPCASERVFIFTDLKIADDVFLDMKKEIHKASVQFMAFYALIEARKD